MDQVAVRRGTMAADETFGATIARQAAAFSAQRKAAVAANSGHNGTVSGQGPIAASG
jgi:hypothetical protein